MMDSEDFSLLTSRTYKISNVILNLDQILVIELIIEFIELFQSYIISYCSSPSGSFDRFFHALFLLSSSICNGCFTILVYKLSSRHYSLWFYPKSKLTLADRSVPRRRPSRRIVKQKSLWCVSIPEVCHKSWLNFFVLKLSSVPSGLFRAPLAPWF